LSSNKTEIDTLKRRFEEVVEKTSIRREELREHRQEQENMKTDITDLKCRSMKNNLIFAGLFVRRFFSTSAGNCSLIPK
jgi:hypothetical protein